MKCSDSTPIASLDGVTLSVHDFNGSGIPLVWAHATGFHAHCYLPLAERLSDTFRSFAFDHRGHGAAESVDPSNLNWLHYGNDAIAATAHIYETNGNVPLVGFGHSMGGATLLMAAQHQPHMFRALFIFEPIVFPATSSSDFTRTSENPLSAGARKRRSRFDSYNAALENFTAKPPLMTFDSAVREQYVNYGFHDATDDDGKDVVELNCAPELEARTYETGGVAPPWEDLPNITVPVWVMSGRRLPQQPSTIAPLIAEKLANATFVQWDEMGHFGPFESPDAVCDYVARTINT